MIDKTIIERIRKRPGMYLGDPHSPRGGLTIIGELLANVIDLHLAGRANRFTLTQDKESKWITVSDNGPGLPFEKIDTDTKIPLAQKHLTIGHDSPTADGHLPHVHLSPLGIGLILINAVSTEIEIDSIRNGVQYTQNYINQKPGKISEKPTKRDAGTKISFTLDPNIFGDWITLDHDTLRATLFSTAHLYPGLQIEYERERYFSEKGLEDFVNLLTAHENFEGCSRAVGFVGGDNEIRINFACGGSRETNQPLIVKAWANGWFSNDGGTHVKGMKAALKEAGLKPEVAMISVVLSSPRFGSPTKSKLVNTEVQALVKNHLLSHFQSSNNDQRH